MKVRSIGVLSVIAVAMSVTPVWAGSVGVPRPAAIDVRSAQIDQLEQVKEQQWREANANRATVKGPLLVRYIDKQAQLQDLINRIQTGQQVSPTEIDQAVQPVVR
jgi:hypothetical protein